MKFKVGDCIRNINEPAIWARITGFSRGSYKYVLHRPDNDPVDYQFDMDTIEQAWERDISLELNEIFQLR